MASGEGSYFILLEEYKRHILRAGKTFEDGKMRRGDIVRKGNVCLVPEIGKTEQDLIFWSVEEKKFFVKCRRTALEPLTSKALELLLAIDDPEERWQVYSDKELLYFGLRHVLCIGKHVQICFPSGKDGAGYIRHVGKITGRNGTWFGIELDKVNLLHYQKRH